MPSESGSGGALDQRLDQADVNAKASNFGAEKAESYTPAVGNEEDLHEMAAAKQP